jgi:hypothetical protein
LSPLFVHPKASANPGEQRASKRASGHKRLGQSCPKHLGLEEPYASTRGLGVFDVFVGSQPIKRTNLIYDCHELRMLMNTVAY